MLAGTRSLARAATLLVLESLVGCSSDASLGERRGCLFGAWSEPGENQTIEAALVSFEALVGRRLDLDRVYYRWDDSFPGDHERWSSENGRTAVPTWRTRRRDDSPVAWASIASGAEDATIIAAARRFAAFQSPVMVILQMDADDDLQSFGTPEDFRAAFRRVVSVFRAEHAGHVRWVWSLTINAFHPTSFTADEWYPGDDVVDWTSVSGYNWYAATTERWLSFSELFVDFRAWASRRPKPQMIAGWGSLEGTRPEESKAIFIEEALQTVKAWPELRAIVYLNSKTTQFSNFAVDSSAESLQAFRRMAADPHFNTRR
jgi:endoglucanase